MKRINVWRGKKASIGERFRLSVFIAWLGLISWGFLCETDVCLATINATQRQTENPVVGKLEIPAKIAGKREQIISHIGYTVSYNSDWKIPNWVAYELTEEEVEGIVPRYNTFVPDPEVPYAQSATTNDYKNSGWDRGHMAPAADMKWSKQAMKESFYLSNICPQHKKLNGGIWKDLEEQVRALASQKGKIYVACGPIVSKQPRTIGTNKVAIPDAFFKALLQNDNGNWSAIAFLFANEGGRKPLSTYAMSVADMQIITGIDFFPALPDSIEERAEREVDFAKWGVSSKIGSRLSNFDNRLSNRDNHLSNFDNHLSNRDNHLSNRDNRLSNRDNRLSNRDNRLANCDNRLANRDNRLANRDNRLANNIKTWLWQR